MTRATRALVADCLHCGTEFVPRKQGHVFCSVECRHKGERAPWDPPPSSPEVVARLFDPSRDPDAIVEADDWAPATWTPEIVELYRCGPSPTWPDRHGDTVAMRRRCYLALRAMGRA